MADPFRFKQFAVHQDRCAMKVGTDGVLLGAWAQANSPPRILDIGTGTGLVALMLAQRFPNARVDAVEIEPNACQQASENFAKSPWSSRLQAVCADAVEFSQRPTLRERYSLIVSNPPWFSNSLKPHKESRSLARHTPSLGGGELVSAAARLLRPDGCFVVIFPADQREEFRQEAAGWELQCSRCCAVKPHAGKPAKRVLMEFRFSAVKDSWEQTELVVETDIRHQYSADFIELTREFYLRF